MAAAFDRIPSLTDDDGDDDKLCIDELEEKCRVNDNWQKVAM